jgi:hypothetical protein
MKSVAKIILGFSLLALAACSGKGSGESRINNVDNDGNDSPSVIDDDTPAGPTGNIIACKDVSGAFCAETTDMSLKSECDPDDGEMLLDKCPSGGTKCNLDIPDVTFYVYNGLVDCKTLEAFMNADWD